MKNIIEAMNWRYATAKFDTEKKLSGEQIEILEEVLRLSPSSFGLQPWKFIVVSNDEIKMKLKEAGYNQEKIAQASHVFVLAANSKLTEESVDDYIKTVSEVRGVSIENLKGYEDMIKGMLSRLNPEQRTEWAKRQVYLALGVLIAAGSTEGIDIAPMEGFEPSAFDKILGLHDIGFTAAVIAAVGFRATDDTNANMKKVRYSKEKVFVHFD